MAKRKKKKRRMPQKQRQVKNTLHEAVMCLRQNDLSAAQHQAKAVMRRAKEASEIRKAEEVLTEIHFRNAMQSQTPAEKLTHLQEALAFSPHEARFHFHRGIALLQAGESSDALKAFDRVAKTEPEREGLEYFRQVARLADKQPLKKRVKLPEKEQNTLKLLELFQTPRTKKLPDTLPEGDVLGPASVWQEFFAMRRDKQYVPPDSTFQQDGLDTSSHTAAILRYYQGAAAMRRDDAETAHTLWQDILSHGFSSAWVQKNVGISMRDDFLNLFNDQRWLDIENKSRRLPPELNDDTLNQIISLALFHQGYEQAEKGKWPQAVKFWNDAAEWSYNRYLAQNLALAQEKMERWEDAAGAWRDVLQRRPRSDQHEDYLSPKQVSAIWEHAGDCYWEAFNEKETLNCLQKAIDYDPENLDLRFKLVTNLTSKDYYDVEKAIKVLNGILDIAPDNLRALTELANLYHAHWRYDDIPVWKRILEIEPDNAEAKHELAQRYIERAMPWEKGGKYFYRGKPSLEVQLEILNEGLSVLPDHPDLVLAVGWAYLDAKKYKKAKPYFLKAFELSPQDPHIAGSVLQNLIIIKADDDIEPLIPEVQKTKGLQPVFWVDEGRDALPRSLRWGERFFDAALEQVEYSSRSSKASVLVDIWMAIPHEEDQYQPLKKKYLSIIEKETPKSGAIEYIQGFTTFSKTGNIQKARRFLRKAKRLAQAADDPFLRQHIEEAEKMLSMPPPPSNLLDMLENMDETTFQKMLEKMGGF